MVETGQKVVVHYVGTLDDGSEFDSSVRREEPLEFIVGSRTMLPAFERVVGDMEPGEERTVRIPAEKAYGPYDESLVEMVPVDAFPHAEQLPVGEYIVLSIVSEPLRVKVDKIENGCIFFDHNHELAGRDLTFLIRLESVRHESAIERERHPAGCACGCDRLKKALSAS